MKVRLKHALSLKGIILRIVFQFHEGPIKTFDFEVREYGLIMFQFHEGPIKTNLLLTLKSTLYCFNSMKVRLKHAYGSADASHSSAFQFHEGPIKTLWFCRCFTLFRVSIP